MKTKFPFYFSLVAGILLVLQAAVNLSAYPDWDELDTSARLAHPEEYVENGADPYGNTDVLTPYKNTRNHALAAAGTKLSYLLFGVSPWSARLPSLFFAALFAAGLVTFARNSQAGIWYVGLGLYFLSNSTLNWFFHSSRGYASMVAAALWMLGLYATSRKNAVAFALFSLAILFSHAFGIFYFLIFGGVIFLVARKSPYFKAWLMGLPVALSILVALFFFLNRSGLLQAKQAHSFAEAVLYAFGQADSAWGRGVGIALLALSCLACIRQVRQLKREELFLPLFALSSLLFLAILFFGLKPDYFDGRFLLAFTLPWVWTVFLLLHRSEGALRWGMAGLALFFFVALPLKDAKYVREKQISHLRDFNEFVQESRKLVPLESTCISFSGEADQTRFARDVFFSRAARRKPCPQSYHLHFGRNWAGEIPFTPPSDRLVSPLYEDGKGRLLARLLPPIENLP